MIFYAAANRHADMIIALRYSCALHFQYGPQGHALMVREAEPHAPRLLDRVRTALRARHYSRRTEDAYVTWIRRYIVFHEKRHPTEMGAPK
jgi:Phage integrase, N-terminal SAM-like domain